MFGFPRKQIFSILENMTDIIILAAGRGTRMESEEPKVLLSVNGKPIIHYLLDALCASGVNQEPIVVVSPTNQKQIKSTLKNYHCRFVVQKKQLGTGHAVNSVFKNKILLEENVMVVMGDHASYSAATFKKLSQGHKKNDSPVTMATTKVPEYRGLYQCFYDFGRIKRDKNGKILGIIEKNDASEEEKEIKEVNPSLYVFKTDWLKKNIEKIKMNKKKGEYYLTDIIAIATGQGIKVNSIAIKPEECLGINTPEDLAQVESLLRRVDVQK